MQTEPQERRPRDTPTWDRGDHGQRVPGLRARTRVELTPVAPRKAPATPAATTTVNARPSLARRVMAGVTGLAMAVAAIVGLVHTMRQPSPGASPFMAAGAMLPAILLLRYAVTGAAKLS